MHGVADRDERIAGDEIVVACRTAGDDSADESKEGLRVPSFLDPLRAVLAPAVDLALIPDRQTFADGMAFGQIAPGPVLIKPAIFIGYKVAGIVGAIAATIAAFLPSFIMTVIAGASLNRFRTNFLVQSFLAGVAPAVVGMLAAAGVSLAKSGLSSPLSYAVTTLAFLLMLRARLNPVVIIFGCGLLQWAVARGFISWLHI